MAAFDLSNFTDLMNLKCVFNAKLECKQNRLVESVMKGFYLTVIYVSSFTGGLRGDKGMYLKN